MIRYNLQRKTKTGEWSDVATGMSMKSALEMFNEMANEFPEWTLRVVDHTSFVIQYVNR